MSYKRRDIPVWRVHYADSFVSLRLSVLARRYDTPVAVARKENGRRLVREVVKIKHQQKKQRALSNGAREDMEGLRWRMVAAGDDVAEVRLTSALEDLCAFTHRLHVLHGA
jgi:hypothetical protein